jgi:hypothetical protein
MMLLNVFLEIRRRNTMKKMFVLMIGIVVMALTLAPLVQAQSAADMKKMEQLQNEAAQIGQRIQLQRRQPTAQEMQRLDQIAVEMAKILGVSPEQFKQMQQMGDQSVVAPPSGTGNSGGGVLVEDVTGETKGWAPASAFSGRVGFTLTPPTMETRYGYTASFTRYQPAWLTIYLSKNYMSTDVIADMLWTAAEQQTIRNHISKESGIKLSQNKANWIGEGALRNSEWGKSKDSISISCTGNVIEIRISVTDVGGN